MARGKNQSHSTDVAVAQGEGNEEGSGGAPFEFPKTKPFSYPSGEKLAQTSVAAGALRAALKDVLGAIHARSEIPILSHVVLHAEGSSLALSGTDLDVWITRTLACDAPEDAKALCVALPAKPLAAVLAELEAETPVTLVREEGEVRVSLKAGRSRFKLACLPVDDFPAAAPFSGVAALDLRCSALADAIAAVRHAISTEETRYYLNGILVHPVEATEALAFAATDGNRLARGLLPIVEHEGDTSKWPALIWMRTTVVLLEKLLGLAAKTGSDDDPAQVLVEVDGEFAGSRLRFDMPAADGGEVTVIAKSIDGTFPEYSRVIPTTFEGTGAVDKGVLAAGVRRVSAIASEKSRAVRCTFTADKLTLSVSTPELGEATEEIPCRHTPAEGAGEFSVGFNADFLLAGLAAMPADTASLAFADPLAPVRLIADGEDPATARLVQVLMPMRV